MDTHRKIIVICGPIQGGKSFLAKGIARVYGETRKGSFADPLYRCLGSILGEERVADLRERNDKETPLPELGGKSLRQALITLGTEWGREMIDSSLWVNTLIRQTTDAAILTVEDTRFWNEYETLIATGRALVVRVQKKGQVISPPKHKSEAYWPFFPFHELLEWDDDYTDNQFVQFITGLVEGFDRIVSQPATRQLLPDWTWDEAGGEVLEKKPSGSRVATPESDGIRWDAYVKNSNDRGLVPGDEWGTEAHWEDRADFLLRDIEDIEVTKIVEIGQGSGKYTKRVLDHYPQSTVLCCDVSRAFLADAEARLRPIYGDRVQFAHLDGSQDSLSRAISGVWGCGEEIDLLFSIDAMVHVDQPMLVNYLSIAAERLRPDGRVAMTLASIDNPEYGVKKLVQEEVRNYFSNHSNTGRMYYWSEFGISEILEFLGFSVEKSRCPHRDIEFQARRTEK